MNYLDASVEVVHSRCLFKLHPTALFPPMIVRLLCDTDPASRFYRGHAFRYEYLGLPQFADDLLGGRAIDHASSFKSFPAAPNMISGPVFGGAGQFFGG
jgi:hypothetical protein